MKMASITLAVDEKLKTEMSKFMWITWSELVKERLVERERQAELLLRKLHSKEEQELIKWSVELGRRVKKGRFKILLSELSPKTREKLLSKLSSEERKELNV
jgi:hypothetical protein